MKIVYFTHSLRSCWNHGNAHFLRGVLRALIAQGHDIGVHETKGAWSLRNLLADHGEAGLEPFRQAYPDLQARIQPTAADPAETCAEADVVIVHEWNDPALVAALGRVRARGGRFVLLFHDTHHRAVSDPEAIRTFDLSGYDGVLAFGEALAEVYCRWGWGNRVFVWHEAADVSLFQPPMNEGPREGLVWIGNWGDDERSAELEAFLMRPAQATGWPLDIYGVRYSPAALGMLARHGARYRGWLANALAPQIFARHKATIHVPRRFYASLLPGIPTIRMFEALACGIPLVSAPWNDAEGLFRAGNDFLMARTPMETRRHFRVLRHDSDLCRSLADNGLETIRARHTCDHRARELIGVIHTLSAQNLRRGSLAEANL